MPIIKQFVEKDSFIYTDELTSYNKLKEDKDYTHAVIKHNQNEYSDGNGTYTNTIEGFWGHFKRLIFGIYHSVSPFYLQRYIDEAVYRYNTREWKEATRFADVMQRALGIIRYSDVTAM